MYKINTFILFAILLQINTVFSNALILNSTDNKELGTKRNTSLGYFNKFLKSKRLFNYGKKLRLEAIDNL